ncbi:Dbl homology domain-containing protein [Dichotomocladium elegans]|nr:Dbl homology domain-containing protein [Dichotomocladium elegans]
MNPLPPEIRSGYSPRHQLSLSSLSTHSTGQPSKSNDGGHLSHKRMVSLGSVSSTNSSNLFQSRYPSGVTSRSSFTLENASCTSSMHASGAAGPKYDRAVPFSDDPYDIMNSLDYDDVDDGMIDSEIVHRNRDDIVQQLYGSERAYLETLELTMNVFFKPLRKDAKQSSFNFLGMKKMVCTERELRWLFGNFEDIVRSQRTIADSFEKRMRIWGPTQIISDVFSSWYQLLDVYHAYLDNYDVAVTTYERLTRYQPFKKFIDAAHKNPSLKGATLLSLLQIPVGTITRYAQFITKLADSTTPMHPDYAGLLSCKQRILSIADGIMTKLQDANNVDEVLTIHQAFVGAPFSVKAQRRLIFYGQLTRIVVGTRSTSEERTYFLFSDQLVIVRPRQVDQRTVLQYKGHLVLERARVRALAPEDASGQEHCFELVSSFHGVDTLNTTYMGSSTVHILKAKSQQDKEEWIQKLQQVIDTLDAAAAKARQLAAARRIAHHRQIPANSLNIDGIRSSNTSTSSSASTQSSGRRTT